MEGIDIKSFHPEKGDVIVITYDKSLVSPTQVVDIYDWLREQFADYQTVLVPKGMTVERRK